MQIELASVMADLTLHVCFLLGELYKTQLNYHQ